MFEVGFTEILLIFAIALLVLGPARLPKLAADVGRWAGRARAMARQLRSQLEQEVQLDPLQDDFGKVTPSHTMHGPTPPVTPLDEATRALPAQVSDVPAPEHALPPQTDYPPADHAQPGYTYPNLVHAHAERAEPETAAPVTPAQASLAFPDPRPRPENTTDDAAPV